ncbi:MAG TPA: 2-oxoglutarate and iron-dependent oxygenase domain-containing protein [Terriglobales bacterium]|nr:2-oxoglutarate and iron-dependent oxygenase domain-containing protein [Terriglobales bacterium]
MPIRSVPIIDIAPFLSGSPEDRRRVAAEVGRACEEIGFLIVKGHGVPGELVDQMYDVSKRFFDLPLVEKMTARGRDRSRGYGPLGEEALSYGLGKAAPADVKESLYEGPMDVPDTPYFRGPEGAPHFVPNVWPERPAELTAVWRAYYKQMERLAGDIMRIFALALDLPEHFFADKIDKHVSRVRAINYPDQREEPLPGQLRAGEHTDYGTMTILKIEDAPGGLQVKTRRGEWLNVEAVPGAFVVNIGDLMMHWTNDRWISTLHRVLNPPRDASLGTRRISLVFFHQPNYDALIECLPSCRSAGNPAKYPPVTSGEHRNRKFAATTVAS